MAGRGPATEEEWGRTVLLAIASALGVSALMLCAVNALGQRRWNALTRQSLDELLAACKSSRGRRIDFAEFATLPPPVQRYLRTVLRDGATHVAVARVRHRGEFDMGKDRPRWKRFTSTQVVTTRPAGFLWNAAIHAAPTMPARVHDAYMRGEGVLRAALFGLIDLVHQCGGGELSRGELMRYMAEAAWYPTALTPAAGFQWRSIDAHSALGAYRDGEIQVELIYRFGADGLIESVYAPARGRTVGTRTEPTPWQGKFWDYIEHSGMLVPRQGEVAWILTDGPRAYWRGYIEALQYDFD